MKGKSNKFLYLTIEFLRIAKDYSPNNYAFLFFFFLTKFSGLIIFSNCFENKSTQVSYLSITSLFRKITFFDHMTRANLTIVSYEYPLIIIYILLLIPFLLWICLLFKSKCSSCTSSSLTNRNNNENNESLTSSMIHLKFSSLYKRSIRIITVLFIIIVFCSQFLIEFLMFPLCMILPNSAIQNPDIRLKVDAISSSFSIHPIIVFSINVLYVALINIYVWFYVLFFNNPFISHLYVIKFTYNNYFLFLLLLQSNLQAFHYYTLFNLGHYINIIFAVIACVTSIIMVFLAMERYVEMIMYNILMSLFTYYAIISGILSILIYYTMNSDPDEVTSTMRIAKILIVIILSFIVHFLLIMLQDYRFNKKIIDNLLLKNKQGKGEYLFKLINILKGCFEDVRNFTILFRLIEDNKTKYLHSEKDVNDKIITLTHFYNKFKNDAIPSELNFYNRQIKFLEQYKELIILIEAEIIIFISNLCNQNKQIKNNIRIPLLHCDFIYYFKLNLTFSLYLIQEYLSKIKGISFISSLNFYTLKYDILMEREKKLKSNLKFGRLHVKFSSFLEYFKETENIKCLLLESCTYFQKIIALKNRYNEIKQQKEVVENHSVNIRNLFDYCMKIDQTLTGLNMNIKNNFNDKQLKNPEICYLLTNFYEIIQNQLPNDLQPYIININSYSSITKFDSAFFDQEFMHPMILSMLPSNHGNNDYNHGANAGLGCNGRADFYINYMSQKLLDFLGYKSNDLIGKDFHYLLPRMFTEAHSIEMKKVLFLNQDFHLNKDIFILSKERYYIRIIDTSGILPSLNNDVLIISNIRIKKTKNNCFLFIVDINNNIVTMTQNFEEKYCINYDMINRLNITFSSLFGINEEKVKLKFKQQLKEIYNINLTSVDNLISVLNENTFDDMINAYNMTHVKEKNKFYDIEQQKKKLVDIAMKLRHQIQEQEYDTDWLNRISSFEKKCALKCGAIDGTFKIHYELHNLGDCPYYFIKVVDHEDPLQSLKAFNISSKLSNLHGEAIDVDYLKKFYENYHKVNSSEEANGFLRKLDANESQHIDNINPNNNTSVLSLNETNQQLLFDKKTQGMIPQRKSNVQQSVNNLSKINNKQKQKAEMKHFNDKSKQKEYILSSIIYGLIGILITMFIINFFLKSTGINTVNENSELIFILVQLKESILESALLVTSGCYRIDDLEPNPYDNIDFNDNMLKAQLYFRSAEMYSYYLQFTEYLKKYYYYTDIQDQLMFLYDTKTTFKALNYDFTIRTYESNFEKELNYFHFHSGFMNSDKSFTQCHIRDHFMGGLKNETHEENIIASSDEIFFYYTTQNIIENFVSLVDDMINQSNRFVIKKNGETELQFMIFNISVLVIGVCILIAMFGLIMLYKTKIHHYLTLFLAKSDKASCIDRKLNNYRSILLCFDQETVELFEDNKEEIEKMKETRNERKTFGSSIISKGKKLMGSIAKKKKEEEEEAKALEESNRKKQPISLFALKIIQTSVIHFIISFVSFISLLIGNIIIDTQLFDSIQFVTEMSYSYMDRTPTLNSILFYFRVSILNGDPYFSTFPREKYHDNLFDFQIADTKINIEDDERFTRLNDSVMSFFFFKKDTIFFIISYFESNSKGNNDNLLPSLREYLQLINTEGKACETFATAYKTYINNKDDLLDEPFLRNSCFKLIGGNLDKGIQSQLNYYYSAVFDEYLDFVAEPTGDLVKYSMADKFVASLKLMTFIYDVNWHITAVLVIKELDELFLSVKIKELIFQFSELILTIVIFLAYLLLTFGSLKKATGCFSQIIEKINHVLNE